MNIVDSSQAFLENTGHSIVDLFNDVLIEEEDMKQLIGQNGISLQTISTKRPGLIIQSYLVLARLFELDVYQPIGQCVKLEVMEGDNAYDNVNFDERHFDDDSSSGHDSDNSDATSTDNDQDDVITCDDDYLRSNRPKKIIKYYGKRRKYHLTRSFITSNYLTDAETIRLCKKTELTKEQLQTWFCHKRDELKNGKVLDDPGSETPSTDEDKPGKGYRPRAWYTSGKHREKVPCDVCGKRISRGGMPVHMKLHEEKTEFQCEQCFKYFCSAFRLKKHAESHMEPVIACSLCDYKGKTEAQLRQHMNKHMGITFDCHLCPVKLSSKSGLHNHITNAHGEKRFACDQCPSSFGSRNQLTSHVKSCHGNEQLTCEQCPGKTFCNKRKLHVHITRVHGPKKPKWMCPDCGAQVQNNSNSIKLHKMVHENSFPFQCEYCDKKFRTATVLRNHLNQHTGAISFPCQHCGKSFTSKGGLWQHLKRTTCKTHHVVQQ